jgi:hypothetical protein
MYKSATFLFAEMLRGGPADEETAAEVHRDHGDPVIGAHPVEDAVAQNARVVHHSVDAAEVVDCRLNDLPCRSPVSDRVSADLGCTAILANDRLGLLRGSDRRPAAGERGADIVDDYLGSGDRHHDGDLPPDAPPAPVTTTTFPSIMPATVILLVWSDAPD